MPLLYGLVGAVMAEVTLLPGRGPQLESIIRTIPNVITVVPGYYWTAACPAGCHSRTAIQWVSDGHQAIQVSCLCGTPSSILAEALNIPRAALSAPPPAPAFLPIHEFMALTGKGARWLLEPFVPVAGLVLLQGAPKSGKTFFAAWLACSVAALGITTLFLEEEGSVDVQGDRFRPFLSDNGVELEGHLLVSFRKRFRLDVTQRVDALIAWIKETTARVVVLDPFKLLHQADEQSASELTPVLDALQRIITETGVTIILIHHTKKGASWDKGDSGDAQSRDARGSGAIVGLVDHVIAVKGLPIDQRVVGEVRFVVECADSRITQPFEKRMAVVKLTGGKDAFTWTETAQQEQRDEALLERALAAIPAFPQSISRDNLRRALRCGKNELRRVVIVGIERGLLREPGKGKLQQTELAAESQK